VGDYRVPLGSASIARAGSDVTLVGYGWAMQEVLAAADLLAAKGVSAEVVDLRSLVPLDMATVLASVAKTRRAMIVHAAVEFGGFGAELAARVQEAAWGALVAPVARLGARYTPVPFARSLEALHFPNAPAIVDKVVALVERR
jgi:pyruvate/2-oxoglutarate/acetoin dehydrogenase E1 component